MIVTGPINLPLWQHYASQLKLLYTCYAQIVNSDAIAAIYNNLIAYNLINVAVWVCGRIDLEESK
jgi:hypothetical protein